MMEDSDSDIDTSDKDTDEINKSISEFAEFYATNSEESDVNAEGERKTDEMSYGTISEEELSEAESPVTDEELEREAKELEKEVRSLRDEEVLLKQMLAGAITKQPLKNKLNFYKFSGLYVQKCTDSKLYVDLTPTIYGKRSGYRSYYVHFHILSDDRFKMKKAHLPIGIREKLCKEEVSVEELRTFMGYLQYVCECTEIKIKQFFEAERELVNADEDGNINVNHTIFIMDNLHVEVGFRPKGQKHSHMWLTVILLYNDKQIYYEPQGIRIESGGFNEEIQRRIRDLFVDGCNQELKFTVWKAKKFISNVLQYVNEQESSSEYVDSP
ncbi:uncharacterized protein LOC110827823 isoform X3 [Zootermopsis nevadensis]|uniref:uncharacterized protein LOC110827823 isoform X3 n=1 Tax=Zootermopsis nevadensis TaxID=136037 RepID=UPI000B8E83D4|nr:uncharacterized protein LOC110827823 isoform X3 [Zootermopsis nevadensis]